MTSDNTLKQIPSINLIAVRATVRSDALGESVERMFDTVANALEHAPGRLDTPIATYAPTNGGIEVVAGYANEGGAPPGTETVVLAEQLAVCGVHRGSLRDIPESWQRLHRWLQKHGYTAAGACREVYIHARGEDQSDWVIELQQPVS